MADQIYPHYDVTAGKMNSTMNEMPAARIKHASHNMAYAFLGFMFGVITIPITFFVDVSVVYRIGSWFMQALFIFLTFFMLVIRMKSGSLQGMLPLFVLGVMDVILMFNTIINERELGYALRFVFLLFVNSTPFVRQYGILLTNGVLLMPKGKPKYSGEFKQRVVETMMREKLSCRETAREYGIADHNAVARWERIYLEEGPEGLYIERRGRGSKGRPEVEEDLLAEVQRLRAENAYLKKLNALVAERVRQEKKQK